MSGLWGAGMSQDELMLRDTVLVLDDDDNVIGSASKKESHIFSPEQSRGTCHRAFSIFLFDLSTNTLLLHQRAADKITFPGVWTNTCCSHPLHGMKPSEVDTPDDVASGMVPGVKHAAIRKLTHELGIPPKELQPLQKALLQEQKQQQNDATTTTKNGNNTKKNGSNHHSSKRVSSAVSTSAKNWLEKGTMEMKFLTRLHYWAADAHTHGPEAPWGEHEIDYCVFMTIPHRDFLTIQPNPEEIEAIRWVTMNEINDMLSKPKEYLFSPWFRILYQQFVTNWWEDLSVTMSTDKYEDFDTIHRFDPPESFMGGAGHAGPLFVEKHQHEHQHHNASSCNGGDAGKKQGAYGKVKTHKESKLGQLCHLDEIYAAVVLLYVKPLKSNIGGTYIQDTYGKDLKEELIFCTDMLNKVSRSFAAVILQLPETLLVDILIFYLVLRALDTVEDDMEAFDGSHDVKIQHLKNFHTIALSMDKEWNMQGVGQGDERTLLERFELCQRLYKALPESSRVVIADITRRMADGMAEFVSKDLGQGTLNVEEYNRYCHFVAGLVGEGLSRLFAATKMEDPVFFENETELSNTMGLFLQKTNIIRDYLEDYVDKRAFWPQTVWKKYTNGSQDLGWFVDESVDEKVRKRQALSCLNELVADALELAPDCLVYLEKLRNPQIFKFCAIPQVMAIATLGKLYNNPDVFTGVVKIRKGLACKLILQCENLQDVHTTFHDFSMQIRSGALNNKKKKKKSAEEEDDPNDDRTVRACEAIMKSTSAAAAKTKARKNTLYYAVATSVVVAAMGAMYFVSPTSKRS